MPNFLTKTPNHFDLPRRINRIAHYALSAAALAKSRLVTAEHLQCAVEEVQ